MADPYPKTLDTILPSDALYQAELSKTKTAQDNFLLKKIMAKFYTHKTESHLFLSNRSYEDIVKHFSGKGVALKKLAKQKKIAELEDQKSEKLKPFIDLLNDPNYQESVGMFQGWLVNIYSYIFIEGQKINHTTLIFTKSVEVKKEEQKSISAPKIR